ncbi:MAG: hypothetical protein H8E14_13505 [Candidatus Marinimicrobia bacterium]|nr:hypothetical protein [Candidatus Neomarinimicrobiota bacterium]
MQGYPKRVATKQDFINLLEMPEHKSQALADLQAIVDVDDDQVLVATTLIDENDPVQGWNTELQDNPNPVWKQKGFAKRQEIVDLIAAQ